jgi:hypothetical protein
MLTFLFYTFLFTTWGLLLLSSLALLSYTVQKNSEKVKTLRLENESLEIEMESKKGIIRALNRRSQQMGIGVSTPGGVGMAAELQNMINSSKSHPEVAEIENGDQVMGVKFGADSYPPSLDDGEEGEGEDVIQS